MTTSTDRSHASHATGPDAETLRDDLSAMAEIVRKEVRREVERVREAAGDLVDRGREKADEMRESVSERVRERPLTSLLIAGGIGLLLGMYAARRRGDD
jgi:ElaB/YqjD/DUF883 family membrane-anchored ribosome-binding protein